MSLKNSGSIFTKKIVVDNLLQQAIPHSVIKQIITILFVLAVCVKARAQGSVGWHWYKITAKDVAEAKKVGVPTVVGVFGARADAVLRMTRVDIKYTGAGARLRVPELPDGVNHWSPMPTY